MIVDKILSYLSEKNFTIEEAIRHEVEKLAGVSFKRQFQEYNESKPGVLRLSSCGQCARKLSYQYHNYEKNGKEIDSRARIIFFQGDLTEAMIMLLAKQAGLTITAYGLNQISCSIKVKNEHTSKKEDITEIFGHPDGIFFDKETKKYYLVECKSMSSYSFDDFQKGNLNDDYICQINAYMYALGLDECIVIGMNKDNGCLHEMKLKLDNEKVKYIYENLESVLRSEAYFNETELEKEVLPERKYQADEKGYFPWNCVYCPYWKTCLEGKAEQVVERNRYRLKAIEAKNE